jgi:hypothetical protein
MFPWKKEGAIKGDLSDKTGNNILKELADIPVKKETQYNKTWYKSSTLPASVSVPSPVPPTILPSVPEPANPMPAVIGAIATTLTSSTKQSPELWSFKNAILFIILIILCIYVLVFGMSTWLDIENTKKDWANKRCSPTIMPFASYFGVNTKDNFEFCMGKIFQTHSSGYLGSIGSMFSQFTTLLTSIFDSISSLRNVVASLGGGINVIFQEFTDRITNFFFQLRLTAIHIKNLMGRLYAMLFSVMYMGMSGITGMTTFTNTYLFSFLDTFCFPGETEILVQHGDSSRRIPIQEVKIGDILLPDRTRVTSTFEFYAKGQEMVQLGKTVVSTNHYVMHNGSYIYAGDHPSAIRLGPWNSDAPLYCLNTSTHTIPIEYLTFLDYDETAEGDEETLQWVEGKINGKKSIGKSYPYVDSCFAINEDAKMKTKRGLISAKDIKIGDKLSTGSEVVGLIRRETSEICTLSNGVQLTPATLYWDKDIEQWKRMGEHQSYTTDQKKEMVSFVVVPNSQIELEDGLMIRDYMEVCSPDSKMHYTAIFDSKHDFYKG